MMLTNIPDSLHLSVLPSLAQDFSLQGCKIAAAVILCSRKAEEGREILNGKQNVRHKAGEVNQPGLQLEDRQRRGEECRN